MEISIFLLIACFASSGLPQSKQRENRTDSRFTVPSEYNLPHAHSSCCLTPQSPSLDLGLCPQKLSSGIFFSSQLCSYFEGCKDRAAGFLPTATERPLARLIAFSRPYASSRLDPRECAQADLECSRLSESETRNQPGNRESPDNSTSASAQLDRLPSRAAGTEVPEQRVQWGSLLRHELFFLAVMHSFRIGTEAGTREALGNPFWSGYLKALGSLHGWSDGDGYYETYLGHPIQGATSGYMWVHHDPKYRVVEFGKNRDYWMSRLRAYAWSFAESEQFKVGLISEASIGQISRYCCAYGFNDHVITPNGGLVWIVVGDAVDRYVVRKIEGDNTSVPLRILARVGLNPPLAMANLMDFNSPWHRENRSGVRQYRGDLYYRPATPEKTNANVSPFYPKFELTAAVPSIMRFSNVSCLGGDGVAGYRISDFVQWSVQVGGCRLLGLPKGWSGDSLTFMTGPQWILHSESRWTPHFHLRAGGQKITEEYCLKYGPPPGGLHVGRPCEDPAGDAQHFEATGAAFSTGGGLDLRLSRAFNLRMADFAYVHTWVPQPNQTDFNQGYRFSVGVGLRVGTW
jgi:hypothetical protein